MPDPYGRDDAGTPPSPPEPVDDTVRKVDDRYLVTVRQRVFVADFQRKRRDVTWIWDENGREVGCFWSARIVRAINEHERMFEMRDLERQLEKLKDEPERPGAY